MFSSDVCVLSTPEFSVYVSLRSFLYFLALCGTRPAVCKNTHPVKAREAVFTTALLGMLHFLLPQLHETMFVRVVITDWSVRPYLSGGRRLTPACFFSYQLLRIFRIISLQIHEPLKAQTVPWLDWFMRFFLLISFPL